MDNYTKTISVTKSPEEAFRAIQNFRGWWSEEIEGNTDKVNETFFYHYRDIHQCKIRLIEAVPFSRLAYRVEENDFNFVKDKSEWVNTRLVFDIAPEARGTKITFTHEGLVPAYECYKVCNDGWNEYIGHSLKNFIETGKGNPNPKDAEGFNKELAEKWGLN